MPLRCSRPIICIFMKTYLQRCIGENITRCIQKTKNRDSFWVTYSCIMSSVVTYNLQGQNLLEEWITNIIIKTFYFVEAMSIRKQHSNHWNPFVPIRRWIISSQITVRLCFNHFLELQCQQMSVCQFQIETSAWISSKFI